MVIILPSYYHHITIILPSYYHHITILLLVVIPIYYLVGGLKHEWIIFPFSWEWKIIPTDFHSIIVPRDRYTTNQMRLWRVKPCFTPRIIRFTHSKSSLQSEPVESWIHFRGDFTLWFLRANSLRTGKIHHAMKMGKSTISTGPFSIAMSVYYGFPIVFL